MQKKAKKARHEQEKSYTERLRGAGGTVGEYAGDGQGEAESAILIPEAVGDPVDADPGFDCQQSEEDEDGDGDESCSDDSHPLLILFDCETTGLSVYSDHITDIGAKVIAPLYLQVYPLSPALCEHQEKFSCSW